MNRRRVGGFWIACTLIVLCASSPAMVPLNCTVDVQQLRPNTTYVGLTCLNMSVLHLQCAASGRDEHSCSNIHVRFSSTSTFPVVTIQNNDAAVSNITVEIENVSSRHGIRTLIAQPVLSIYAPGVSDVKVHVRSSNLTLETIHDATENAHPAFLFSVNRAPVAALGVFRSSHVRITVTDSVLDCLCNNSRSTMIGWNLEDTPYMQSIQQENSDIDIRVTRSRVSLASAQWKTDACANDMWGATLVSFISLHSENDNLVVSVAHSIVLLVEGSTITLLLSDVVSDATANCDAFSAMISFVRYTQVWNVTLQAESSNGTVGFFPLNPTAAGSSGGIHPSFAAPFRASLMELRHADVLHGVYFSVSRGCHFEVYGSVTAALIEVVPKQRTSFAENCTVTIDSSSVLLHATGGTPKIINARFAAIVVIVSKTPRIRFFHIDIRNVSSSLKVLCGRGKALVSSIASLVHSDGGLVDSTIRVSDSVCDATNAGDSVATELWTYASLFFFTALTSLISLASTDSSNGIVSNSNVSLTQCSLVIVSQGFDFPSIEPRPTPILGAPANLMCLVLCPMTMSNSRVTLQNSMLTMHADAKMDATPARKAFCGLSTVKCVAASGLIIAFDTGLTALRNVVELVSPELMPFIQITLQQYEIDLTRTVNHINVTIHIEDSLLCCNVNELYENCVLVFVPGNAMATDVLIQGSSGSFLSGTTRRGWHELPPRCSLSPIPSINFSLWTAIGVTGTSVVNNSVLALKNTVELRRRPLVTGVALLSIAGSLRLLDTTIMFERMTVVRQGGGALITATTLMDFVPSNISFLGRSQVIVSQCEISGARSFCANNRTLIAPRDGGEVGGGGGGSGNKAIVAPLQLGCNLWEGAPLELRTVVESVQPRLVEYPYGVNSTFQGSDGNRTAVVCNPRQTSPDALDSETDSAGAGTLAAPIASVVVVVVAAFAANANFGVVGDLQALFAAGMSDCSPPALQSISRSSSFMLSPLFSVDSKAYQVLCNISIFLCIALCHRFAVWVVGRYQRARMTTLVVNNSSLSLSNLSLSFSSSAATFPRSPQQRVEVRPAPTHPPLAVKSNLPPNALLQFPNHSFTAALLFAPGIIRCIPVLLSGRSGDGESLPVQLFAGCLAVLVVAGGCVWRVREGRGPIMSRFRFVLYRRAEMHSVRLCGWMTHPVPRWMLPLGRWEPALVRLTYGRLRGAVRGGSEWLSAYQPSYQLLLCLFSGIPVPATWCIGFWVGMCVIQLAVIGVILRYRPGRAPLSDVHMVLQLLVGCLATALCAGTPYVPQDIVAGVMICAICCSVVRVMHVALVFRWEAKAREAQDRLGDAPRLPSPPTVDLRDAIANRQISRGQPAGQRDATHRAERDRPMVGHNDGNVERFEVLARLIEFAVESRRMTFNAEGSQPQSLL